MKNILTIHIIIALFLLSLMPFTARAQDAPAKLKFGKYGCTASKYHNGMYEYTPKGFFVITKNGEYTYSGFKTPSSGKYSVDKTGNLIFKGGYLDGGKAEKIDRPNKFFLVFPANPDNRWTCGCIDK